VGFKYTIDRSWGVGLELGLRKTFTDYIDDVSTTYFDFAGYNVPNAPFLDYISDPSLHDPEAGPILPVPDSYGEISRQGFLSFAIFLHQLQD
jgi:hypothetical protein